MQNRNRSQSYPKRSFFDQAFAAAHERAARGAGDATAEEDEPTADERALDELIDGATLLRMLSEPVDWLLALAHRLAGDDPIDLSAIARIYTAFHARLRGQPARVRTSDVLIVLGLLMAAFDPRLVLRALGVAPEATAEAPASPTPIAFFVASPAAAAPAPGVADGPPRPPEPSRPCCAFHALLADLL